MNLSDKVFNTLVENKVLNLSSNHKDDNGEILKVGDFVMLSNEGKELARNYSGEETHTNNVKEHLDDVGRVSKLLPKRGVSVDIIEVDFGLEEKGHKVEGRAKFFKKLYSGKLRE